MDQQQRTCLAKLSYVTLGHLVYTMMIIMMYAWANKHMLSNPNVYIKPWPGAWQPSTTYSQCWWWCMAKVGPLCIGTCQCMSIKRQYIKGEDKCKFPWTYPMLTCWGENRVCILPLFWSQKIGHNFSLFVISLWPFWGRYEQIKAKPKQNSLVCPTFSKQGWLEELILFFLFLFLKFIRSPKNMNRISLHCLFFFVGETCFVCMGFLISEFICKTAF